MTPPNTIPSSISPLEMATAAPTHSPTHTTHANPQYKGEEERTQDPLNQDGYYYTCHPTVSRHPLIISSK